MKNDLDSKKKETASISRAALLNILEDLYNAKEALRESEEKYRTVLEASPDPIVAYDMEGMVIYLNPAFTQVFGWTPDELLGKKIDYVPEENWPQTQMMIDKVLAGKSFSVIESRRHTKQKNILDVSISVATYLDRNGIPIGSVHTLRDITERKRIEAQLQQAQKIEAVGTLAGGIAHDFNNLLMGIQGNVSLMVMDMDSTHPYHDRLKNIEKQVQSGARLTSHLLGYARKGRYEVKPLDLNKLVEETCETFGRTKREITIHQELAENLFAIEADQDQIEQVLLNLFVNAADAMHGGGNLILKTMNVTHNNMQGKLYDPKPGNYALLMVTDTGMGMDKEIMERIFDPFFTTKEMGRGTGLGLASTYGIIKGHDGYIDVESRERHGATFSVYLPASEKRIQKTVKAAEQFIKRTGTVLLVDDEEVILEVGQELLEAMGYRVLLARHGKKAIEVYKKHQDEIDLVLLDMVMPNMGGGETYDRMKEINPDIKVLLSSGFSIDGEATEILERGCNGFIQKPFTIKDLCGKIEKILEKG
ncbi:MAG: PAS domain S-box protein [Desulfobacterales bacterium]|nr:PAS domain S-box protein [Desulfobacterales bacterium]